VTKTFAYVRFNLHTRIIEQRLGCNYRTASATKNRLRIPHLRRVSQREEEAYQRIRINVSPAIQRAQTRRKPDLQFVRWAVWTCPEHSLVMREMQYGIMGHSYDRHEFSLLGLASALACVSAKGLLGAGVGTAAALAWAPAACTG
jgi:hypothetical protein